MKEMTFLALTVVIPAFAISAVRAEAAAARDIYLAGGCFWGVEEYFSRLPGVQGSYSQPLAVELLPLQNYYLAEDYHQDYLRKNPKGYCHISFDSLKDVPDVPRRRRNPSRACTAYPCFPAANSARRSG